MDGQVTGSLLKFRMSQRWEVIHFQRLNDAKHDAKLWIHLAKTTRNIKKPGGLSASRCSTRPSLLETRRGTFVPQLLTFFSSIEKRPSKSDKAYQIGIKCMNYHPKVLISSHVQTSSKKKKLPNSISKSSSKVQRLSSKNDHQQISKYDHSNMIIEKFSSEMIH